MPSASTATTRTSALRAWAWTSCRDDQMMTRSSPRKRSSPPFNLGIKSARNGDAIGTHARLRTFATRWLTRSSLGTTPRSSASSPRRLLEDRCSTRCSTTTAKSVSTCRLTTSAFQSAAIARLRTISFRTTRRWVLRRRLLRRLRLRSTIVWRAVNHLRRRPGSRCTFHLCTTAHVGNCSVYQSRSRGSQGRRQSTNAKRVYASTRGLEI